MPDVPFVGGPCAGKTQFFYDPPAVGFIVPCGYHSYAYQANGTLRDLGPASAGTGSGGMGVNTQQVGKAWHRFMHVFAVQTPQSLRRSRAARARIKRLVR